MKDSIAVLFGPQGGNTENVAKIIAQTIGNNAVLIPINQVGADTLSNYKNVIIGGSTIGAHTWKHKNPSKDWEQFLPVLRKLDFTGKKVALFGLGDFVTYPNNFVDDMRIIYDAVCHNNGTVVGFCSTDGYDYQNSEAVIDGKFVGLPLDHDNQPELTPKRVKKWADIIIKQFN